MKTDAAGSGHVLVVDDNPAKRYVIAQILRAGGFVVTEAVCGSDALILAQDQPDVIVLDVDLPDINGLEVCRRIKAGAATSRIPVLHISAKFITGNDKADGLEGGADGYLTEPVEPRELRAAVGAMLRIRYAETELVRANQSLRDEIAERQRVERALRESEAKAEAANNAKSEFLANMSHEVRTPMTAILGYADMLLACDGSDARRTEYIQTIRRQGEHLLTILNDILDLSKIEAGKLKVERIDCALAQIIDEAMSLMRVRAIEKKLQLSVSFAGPVPQTIKTDPTRLRQILINLMGNAIKFTESGDVQVVVGLDQAPQSLTPRLRLEVIDSGIGISSEQIEHLFQPFAQADGSTSRRFGGTGLGLTICKRLAQMLGGDITCQSRPGYGSRFTIIMETGDLDGIPMMSKMPEAVDCLASPAAGATPQPEVASLMRGRVLLAEDGVHIQRVITFYLEQAGLNVTTAENGRVACEKALAAVASQQPFDLIFMDMQMPEQDGYSATAELRSRGYAGPIVALTAHAMAEDRDKCLKCGCTDYLSKPVRKLDLLDMAHRYITSSTPSLPVASKSAPLRSSADIDPEVRQFLPSFVAGLPHQVFEIQSQLERGNMVGLKEIVHQLKGTGGLYGFDQITLLAGKAEHAIHAGVLQDIDADVKALVDLVRSVDGYNPILESAHARG